MKPLQKTLAIIAFLILSTQTVRHAYVLWLEPRGSVLDKFDQPLKDEISSAASLEELLRRYEPVRKQFDAANQEKKNPEDRLPYGEKIQTEPFRSERALRDAITEWESRSKETRQLRFYWSVGFGLFAVGVFAYRLRNHWLGLTLVIAGFSEQIYWTSPTFIGSNIREFDRLLGNKLAFSVVSLALSIGTILYLRIFTEKVEQA